MIFTENFREQHEDILGIVKEISALLVPSILTKNAKEVRVLLSTLAGKLTVHLTSEDKSLYPKLISHESEEVRLLAQKYIDEMGNIKEVFGAFSKKWYNPTDIQEKPEEFIKEINELFSALGKRVEMENNELYTLVDKLQQK